MGRWDGRNAKKNTPTIHDDKIFKRYTVMYLLGCVTGFSIGVYALFL